MEIFENTLLFNPVTCNWTLSSFSVENGRVIQIGKPNSLSGDTRTDLKGARVVPGLIDAHVHIESSLLTPREFGRVSVSHGVTTVIADPHEIANVAGNAGIDFMIQDAEASPADIFFMVPSCVPATPIDIGGAVVTADDLAKYQNNPKVIGLGEMMNLPGVLAGDPEVKKKLSLFKHVDGHAPGVTGETLQKYVATGIKTDHESSTLEEGREKLEAGMYLLLREGDAAKNVRTLTPLVTEETSPRCAFCTDDRHVDSLVKDGSIDNCIRVAQTAGMPLELALRLATLSAAECFGLTDRGMLAPGRIADFCILNEGEIFSVKSVYRRGQEFRLESAPKLTKTPPSPPFICKIPDKSELELPKGNLRVIGTIPGELITDTLHLPQDDVQKIVSIDRYRGTGFGVGLIAGLSLKQGAFATSVSHDAHNIIAAGATDEEIITAVNAVVAAGGGMCVVFQGKTNLFPLPVCGLMTDKPFEEANEEMTSLQKAVSATGAKPTAFMTLSFMGLTVIPHLKITPRGLFDGDSFCDVKISW